MTPPDRTASRYRSKTLASWLALLAGPIGVHRFYLYGFGDRWAWFHLLPTAAGALGIYRMIELGQDDRLAWILIPFMGVVLAASMLTAIIYGLRPDEAWNARFNPAGRQHRSNWFTVLGVVAALMIGAGILMATIAFTGQRYFEYRQDA